MRTWFRLIGTTVIVGCFTVSLPGFMALAAPPDNSIVRIYTNGIKLTDSVVVKVDVKGIKHLGVIDTGASLSVMSEEQFLSIGGTLTENEIEAYLPAVSKNVNLQQGNPIKVKLPAHDVSVMLSPFVLSDTLMNDPDFSSFRATFNDVDIILGLDFLSQVDFTLNYETGRFDFSTPDHSIVSAKKPSKGWGFPVFVAQHELNCVIDTGAYAMDGILIQRNHPDYSTLRSYFDKAIIEVSSGSWTKDADLVYDPEGRLPNFKGQGFLVSFEPLSDPIELIAEGCVIGAQLLQFSILESKASNDTLDVKGRLPPVRYNKTGIQLLDYYPQFKITGITSVREGSSADDAGVNGSEDILIAVNDVPITIENSTALLEAMYGKSGSVMKLTVQKFSFPLEDNPNSIRHINVILANVLE